MSSRYFKHFFINSRIFKAFNFVSKFKDIKEDSSFVRTLLSPAVYVNMNTIMLLFSLIAATLQSLQSVRGKQFSEMGTHVQIKKFMLWETKVTKTMFSHDKISMSMVPAHQPTSTLFKAIESGL